MKKIIFLILTIAIFFSGCNLIDEIDDNIYARKAKNHTLYYNPDFEIIQTLADISKFVMNAVEYRSESKDIWSDPEEVYLRGWGDCDDMTILANDIAKVLFDVEYHIILIDSSTVTRHVGDGGFIDHMMSYHDGVIYEAQRSMIQKLQGKVAFYYYFDEVFTQASPLYIKYKSTKIYNSYEETWAEALDPCRSYILMGDNGKWKIINQ